MPSRFGPRVAARLTPSAHPKCDLSTLTHSHPINSTLQLILPSASESAPASAPAASAARFTLATVRLGDLVAELVAHRLEQRDAAPRFQALALGPALDRHGGIAFTPDNMLHMAVTRELFQQLGLPGKESRLHPGERYNISIKLDAKGFNPGRAFYSKVVSSLNEQLGPCTLAMAWSSAGQPTCPASPTPASMEVDGASHSETADASSDQAAPSHGLRSVVHAQGKCCVSLLRHKQWSVCPVRVPLLDRQVSVESGSSSESGTGRVNAIKAKEVVRQKRTRRRSDPGTKLPGGAAQRVGGSTQQELSVRDSVLGEGESVQLQQEGVGREQNTGAESMQAEGAAACEGLHEVEGVQGERGALQSSCKEGVNSGGQKGGGKEGGRCSTQNAGKLRADSVQAVHQWLGALCCRLPGVACDRLLPEDWKSRCAPTDRVHVEEWSGLLTCELVHHQIQAAQHAVASQQLPWAAVSVWGWQDSPVAWADMEHSSAPNLGLGGSESSYAVLVLPGQDLLILRALSAGDA